MRTWTDYGAKHNIDQESLSLSTFLKILIKVIIKSIDQMAACVCSCKDSRDRS